MSDRITGGERIETAIRLAAKGGHPALTAFITAGFPTREGFADLLRAVAGAADIVEIGVPFSDPMADGVTIQASSRRALDEGVTLRWILDTLAQASADPQTRPAAPLLLMSYLNPLLSFGFDNLAQAAVHAGISGFIVPDLPDEEAGPCRKCLQPHGLAFVQFVTPVTPPDRIARLCKRSQGFVYAVTVTGITGGGVADSGDGGPQPAATSLDRLATYLDEVRAVSPVPVQAGFGIRSARQVKALAGHADGVIVGSALVETLQRDEDPVAFLRGLRPDDPRNQGSDR